jgi:hypothetical protein
MNNNPTNKMMQMITNHVDHSEYEHFLDETNLSVDDMLKLSKDLYDLFSARWEAQQALNDRGVNPFEVISLLEARVAILARTGDAGYADWMRDMWDLAIRYSDQAGLGRKLSLFAELVASTKSDLSREERSVLFYTRALNRLAQLTDYWIGEDEARPLWNELMEYALTSMQDEEQREALNVIKGNAPWFARENPTVFASEDSSVEDADTMTWQPSEFLVAWGDEHFSKMPVGSVWAPEDAGVQYQKMSENSFILLHLVPHQLAREHHQKFSILMETCGFILLAS